MMSDRDEGFRSEDPLEELASDLWAWPKAMSAMTDKEQLAAWYQAVDVLHDFGKLAETLHNDALLLAVTDAKGRAKEELNRAVWRLNRPEGAELHPQEEERLRQLMRRSDTVTDAYFSIEDIESEANPARKAEMLAVLKDLMDEASEAYRRYKLEVGLDD
jgi:hypothetical protein